jgi:hypothetical protein
VVDREDVQNKSLYATGIPPKGPLNDPERLKIEHNISIII